MQDNRKLFQGAFQDLPKGVTEYLDPEGNYHFWSGEGEITDPETWDSETEVYGSSEDYKFSTYDPA